MSKKSMEAKQSYRIDVGGLRVFCAHTNLRDEMAQNFAILNLNVKFDVLLDAPTGWAFCFCHRHFVQKQSTLVLTANPCPEYKLTMRQKAFVLPTFQIEAVHAFLSGEREEQPLSTPLSPVELLTLNRAFGRFYELYLNYCRARSLASCVSLQTPAAILYKVVYMRHSSHDSRRAAKRSALTALLGCYTSFCSSLYLSS